jgi:Flp pilus assembly protein TadB
VSDNLHAPASLPPGRRTHGTQKIVAVVVVMVIVAVVVLVAVLVLVLLLIVALVIVVVDLKTMLLSQFDVVEGQK